MQQAQGPLDPLPAQTLSLILLFALVWVLVCIALAGFVAVYVELSVSCTQLGQNANFTGFQDRMLCIPTYSLFSKWSSLMGSAQPYVPGSTRST